METRCPKTGEIIHRCVLGDYQEHEDSGYSLDQLNAIAEHHFREDLGLNSLCGVCHKIALQEGCNLVRAALGCPEHKSEFSDIALIAIDQKERSIKALIKKVNRLYDERDHARSECRRSE